jgi:fucose 4-O-acetylase-like acetyltransferase
MVRRLLYPNGLAILFVVLFHTTSWGMTAMFAWTPRYLPVSEPVFDQTGSLPYYWVRFVEQVVVVAVPALLFVSGYFVAFTTGQRDNLAWSQIWGRIKKLLIPYTPHSAPYEPNR